MVFVNNVFFNILQLIYVDSIECTGMKIDRGVRAVEFWTKERLKHRQDWEIKNGGFGVGKIIGLSAQMLALENEANEIDEVGDNDCFEVNTNS